MAKPSINIDAFIEHYLTYLNEYAAHGYPRCADIQAYSPVSVPGDKIKAMYKYFNCSYHGTLKQQIHHHYKIYNEIDQLTLSLFGIS